jgi:two-component system chemotaxis response regulator CheB
VLDPQVVVAIGASTGGTVAIESLLRRFPANSPGTVIVQHMPAGFTRHFADRLDKVCRLQVREASDGAPVEVGTAWIAPGGYHTLVQRDGPRQILRVKEGPPVNRHKPSVDVLFHSVARAVGPKAVGVVLSGMGSDGAKGLLAMRTAGAQTFAQDESTSVVYGMPKAAVELGAAERVATLDELPALILASLMDPATRIPGA